MGQADSLKAWGWRCRMWAVAGPPPNIGLEGEICQDTWIYPSVAEELVQDKKQQTFHLKKYISGVFSPPGMLFGLSQGALVQKSRKGAGTSLSQNTIIES